jgi:hypothetical protein
LVVIYLYRVKHLFLPAPRWQVLVKLDAGSIAYSPDFFKPKRLSALSWIEFRSVSKEHDTEYLSEAHAIIDRAVALFMAGIIGIAIWSQWQRHF